jgi:hypothetical protein
MYTIVILPVLYGCGTWLFTLWKEQMVNVIDNNVQKQVDITCLGDAVCFPLWNL